MAQAKMTALRPSPDEIAERIEEEYFFPDALARYHAFIRAAVRSFLPSFSPRARHAAELAERAWSERDLSALRAARATLDDAQNLVAPYSDDAAVRLALAVCTSEPAYRELGDELIAVLGLFRELNVEMELLSLLLDEHFPKRSGDA